MESVILDANVVIKLHELQLWHRVRAKCQVHLAETVVQEVDYYEINAQQIWIDKQALRSECAPFSVTPEQVRCFLSQFDRSYQDRLDLGELESLVYLFSQRTAPGHLLICSADSIVWQILGCLNKPDHGISLEELLKQLGLTKHLERQYTEDFRVHWSKRGSQDWIQGRGKKR